MKIINISHVSFPEEHDPQAWIGKSSFFKGIWEAVAQKDKVIFIDFINYSGTVERNGLEYRFLKRSRNALRLPWQVHRMIAREDPDAVIVHGTRFPLQTLSLRFFLKRKCKLIVQNHDNHWSQRSLKQRFKRPLQQYLQRMADKYIDAYFFTHATQAVPYERAGIIKDHAKVKEIMEISSVFRPVDREIARRFTGVTEKRAYIWVGHLSERKNPMLAVRAFAGFAATEPDVCLYMIFQSDTLLARIKAWLDLHPHAAKQIRLVGKVPHHDLLQWFGSADFMLSTSRSEVAGVSVAEGMSCGCIPLLSDIPAFRSMTGGECGLIYREGDEQSLLEALQETTKMDISREREQTLRRFEQSLSFDAIANEIRTVLQTL
jgi:glycosyltransferase involved in cell wall biosynthesis